MVNWWLIVLSVIVAGMVVAGILYLLCVYASPDDQNSAYFAKVIVVMSASLACFTVLLLPFDVANRADAFQLGSTGGGLNLAGVWLGTLTACVIDVVVILPFAIFYYESLDPEHKGLSHQCIPAFGYTLASVVIFVVGLTVGWSLIGQAEIPFESYEAPVLFEDAFLDGDLTDLQIMGCPGCNHQTEHLQLTVSIFVFGVALLSLLGWFIFVVFGSVGLAGLPVDLIRGFMNHPKPIMATDYNKAKERIGHKTVELFNLGKEIEKSQRDHLSRVPRGLKAKVIKFKIDTENLGKEYDRLEVAYKNKGGSPFYLWGKLLLAILSVMLSICWYLHIFLYNLTEITPFLNEMFVALDQSSRLFGVVAYGLFTFYLLWATVKGVVKVGMRFILFEVHPMKPHDTLMNAFLANCILVVTASVTVTQFTAMSFRPYASETAVDSMFMTYIRNIKGLGLFFWYVQYAFLGVCLLSFFLILCCCTGRKKRKRKKKQRREALGPVS